VIYHDIPWWLNNQRVTGIYLTILGNPTQWNDQARCNTLGQDLSAAARLLRRAPGQIWQIWQVWQIYGTHHVFFLCWWLGPDIKGPTILRTELQPATSSCSKAVDAGHAVPTLGHAVGPNKTMGLPATWVPPNLRVRHHFPCENYILLWWYIPFSDIGKRPITGLLWGRCLSTEPREEWRRWGKDMAMGGSALDQHQIRWSLEYTI